MKNICAFLLLFCCAVIISAENNKDKPIMQIAILLDTSNSMDGLIEQAKTQLWGIVNELIQGENHDTFSEFQLALYEYGNDNLPPENGFIRMVMPFTTDIDRISEALFSLTTNGGAEYCGWAIQSSVTQLLWSNLYSDYKSIFIAGNEPFNQGDISFHDSCLEAFKNGIVVHTIHCGDYQTGVNELWQEGAVATTGNYMVINQDYVTNSIASQQDDKIEYWNDRLNATYVPYGDNGISGKNRQLAEDNHAKRASLDGYMQRIEFKTSRFYQNSSWDIIDGLASGNISAETIAQHVLPVELQEMTTEEIAKYIQHQKEERQNICIKIKELQQQRREFLSTEQGDAKADTLKAAMVKALRKQLKK